MRNSAQTHRILVIGAGYTGMTAALRLARKTRARGGQVTLVNPRDRFTERLRMHMAATGQRLRDYQIPELVARTGVEFVRGWVTHVDADARAVTVSGRQEPLTYDTVIFALGSRAATGPVPGAAEFAFALDGQEQADRLARTLPEIAERGGTVAVRGTGLTGIEAATEIAETHPGLRVMLVGAGRPGSMMSDRARAYLDAALDRLGIQVRSGVQIVQVTTNTVELSDGSAIPVDACLWTAGVRVPSLATDAGITTDDRGRVVTDRSLRSVSHPSVYAVGDAAAVPQAYGVMHGTCQGGIPTAIHAADQISRALDGKNPRPFRFGYLHQPVSLGRGDAVIQFTHPDDSPARWYLTGRAAIRYKEIVSSSPLPQFRLFRWFSVPEMFTRRTGGRKNRAAAGQLLAAEP